MSTIVAVVEGARALNALALDNSAMDPVVAVPTAAQTVTEGHLLRMLALEDVRIVASFASAARGKGPLPAIAVDIGLFLRSLLLAPGFLVLSLLLLNLAEAEFQHVLDGGATGSIRLRRRVRRWSPVAAATAVTVKVHGVKLNVFSA